MRNRFNSLLLLAALLFSGYSGNLLAAESYAVPFDTWTIISIPAGTDETTTVESVFGASLPIDELQSTWTMFGFDVPSQAGDRTYVQLTPDTKLHAGKGYWFIQRVVPSVTIDLPRGSPQAPTRVTRGCQSIVGCTSVPASFVGDNSVSWNMLGLPVGSPVALSDIRVTADTGPCAPGCSLTQAFEQEILYNGFFRHTAEGVGYELLLEGSSLDPWQGIWAAALPASQGTGLRLEIPTPLPPSQTPDLSEYRMVFNDEFNGSSLDRNKWNTGLLWGPYIVINNEEQVYVDSLGLHEGSSYDPFSFTPEGTLKITASATSDVGAPPAIPEPDADIWRNFLEYRAPGPNDRPYVEEDVGYLSGIITSYESFKFTHGYVETRAKVPVGKGLWPAFWLLPTHYVEDIPEIDVMEYLGDDVNRVYHTYHYFDVADDYRGISTPSFETIGPDFSRDFHVYSASWDPEQIIWYVDGIEVRRIDRDDEYKVANQAMYLIANLAVGGNWPGSPDENTVFPAEFEIDYIRAYKKELASPLDLSEYKLVFSDEFTGTTLDASKWTTRFVWGPYLTINQEEQYYIDSLGIDSGQAYSPFLLANGNLTIRGAANGTETPPNMSSLAYEADDPFWDDKPNNFYQAEYTQQPYTSGIITSRNSFSFTHGYAEIRAKVPVGDGLWPAFWLLNKYYVGPQPEIDIMEILGENPGEVIHSYHRRNEVGVQTQNSFRSSGGSALEGFGDDFHTFGVQWTDESISWYVDGELKHTFTDATVSYQVMYVIANLAVGGVFNQEPVDIGALPAEYVIDYIRVYQEKPLP